MQTRCDLIESIFIYFYWQLLYFIPKWTTLKMIDDHTPLTMMVLSFFLYEQHVSRYKMKTMQRWYNLCFYHSCGWLWNHEPCSLKPSLPLPTPLLIVILMSDNVVEIMWSSITICGTLFPQPISTRIRRQKIMVSNFMRLSSCSNYR